MRKIVIIGNSAAGVCAAEAIRRRDKESSVTMVSDEPFLAYQRQKIFSLFDGAMKERDLYFKAKDFYADHKIELLLEKEVVELNIKKKRAIFKDDDFLEFDELIIATGSKVALPDLKGIHKEGVVALTGLREAKILIENIPLAHTVIVVGSGPLSCEMSRIIASKKIEVKLLGTLTEPLEGVEVIADNPITEILGESEVKAVRLSSNKVIGASLVVYPGPREPRVDFLRDTGINIRRGIVVDKQMRTNIPFIYAVGDVCEIEGEDKPYNWAQAEAEGRLAGEILSNSVRQ